VSPAQPAAGLSELPGRAVSAVRRSFPGSAGVPCDRCLAASFRRLSHRLSHRVIGFPFPRTYRRRHQVLRHPGKGPTSWPTTPSQTTKTAQA